MTGDAEDAMLRAERELAASRGESYAEVVDLGVRWDIGAPLPQVVSDSRQTVVLCYAEVPDPTWDGSYVTIKSVADTSEDILVEITFEGCDSSLFGGPNDEALEGHPLYGRGLDFYEAHIVHNSTWLEEQIAINSVHPCHRDETWRELNHYILTFHDEMLEVLARSVKARLVRGTMRSLLMDVVEQLTAGWQSEVWDPGTHSTPTQQIGLLSEER